MLTEVNKLTCGNFSDCQDHMIKIALNILIHAVSNHQGSKSA